MCDFHSVCINREGRIAHVASNSHSEAVREFRWPENTASRTHFWECEWDGIGMMPEKLVQHRHGMEAPPECVLDAARLHYEKLAEALATGQFVPPFDGQNYADVRSRVGSNASTPAETLAKLASDPDA